MITSIGTSAGAADAADLAGEVSSGGTATDDHSAHAHSTHAHSTHDHSTHAHPLSPDTHGGTGGTGADACDDTCGTGDAGDTSDGTRYLGGGLTDLFGFTRRPDGSVTSAFADGSSTTIGADGSYTWTGVDGGSVTMRGNGSLVRIDDGGSLVRDPDGQFGAADEAGDPSEAMSAGEAAKIFHEDDVGDFHDVGVFGGAGDAEGRFGMHTDDGRVETADAEGNFGWTDGAGNVFQSNVDGTFVHQRPDGSVVSGTADGEVEVHAGAPERAGTLSPELTLPALDGGHGEGTVAPDEADPVEADPMEDDPVIGPRAMPDPGGSPVIDAAGAPPEAETLRTTYRADGSSYWSNGTGDVGFTGVEGESWRLDADGDFFAWDERGDAMFATSEGYRGTVSADGVTRWTSDAGKGGETALADGPVPELADPQFRFGRPIVERGEPS